MKRTGRERDKRERRERGEMEGCGRVKSRQEEKREKA